MTYEDWAEVLSGLLDEAESAIERNSSDKKREIIDSLVDFIEKSPPKCADLNEIASKATNNLILNQVRESTKRIVSRNAELKKAVNLLKDVTEEAKKDRKQIRFENLIEAIEKVKGIAETLKDVESALSNPEADLLAKIEAVTKAVEKYKGDSNTN